MDFLIEGSGEGLPLDDAVEAELLPLVHRGYACNIAHIRDKVVK